MAGHLGGPHEAEEQERESGANRPGPALLQEQAFPSDDGKVERVLSGTYGDALKAAEAFG
jgi:hypothetical protein